MDGMIDPRQISAREVATKPTLTKYSLNYVQDGMGTARVRREVAI